MSLEDVEELLGTNIGSEEDYDTLSGLITDTLDRIPAKNEHPSVRIGNVEFTVLMTEERRIAKLARRDSSRNRTNRKSVGRRIKIIIS